MEKINISTHLKKEYWRRRVEPDAVERHIPMGAGDYYEMPHTSFDDDAFDNYTQEDFMRENTSSAHKINSKYMSLRPIYDVRTKKDAQGNILKDEDGKPIKEWFVAEFDKLETVRYGLQRRINLSKAAHLAGNGFWITHENKNHQSGETLNSWKDTAGLDTAWQELVQSCFLTGDGAIYLYMYGGSLHYQVFSYLKGDVLFPDYDQDHNPVIYRLYTLRGKRAVDIYACDYIETWIEGDKESEKDQAWWVRFGGWFAKGLQWNSEVRSDDGWRRISHTQSQTPKGMNQCTYWRIDDIPSGVCEQEVCSLERAASFVADGVKSTSQAILFLKAANVESLPENDTTGKKIGVKGTVDELAASDAKFLAPPDLSSIANVDLNNKHDSILKSSMGVNITADVFRSGDPSTASMKLLFTDAIIWCKNIFPQFYPQLKCFVEVFKQLTDKVTESKGEIATMRTSCGVDFWIPQNDSEVLKRELDQVSARVKSRQAAMSDIGNNHTEDYEQIRKEWEEELRMKAEIPAKAKAEVEAEYGEPTEIIEVDENKSSNPVDKRMSGRSIQDR